MHYLLLRVVQTLEQSMRFDSCKHQGHTTCEFGYLNRRKCVPEIRIVESILLAYDNNFELD